MRILGLTLQYQNQTTMNVTNLLYSLVNILNEMSPYILLGFLIAGLLHVFVPASMMSRHLSGNGWRPVVKAALFGIPLPLCSCGVLPTAVSLRRQGASKAASTSFLIATPQTGVDSIAATYSLLGLPFAIIRPVAALIGAMLGGLAVGHFDPDKTDDTHNIDCACTDDECPKGFFAKIIEAIRYGLVDMVASVGKWLVIGLVVAALITVFVPDSLFLSLSKYPLPAMFAVVIVAIPMYICATGSIPIAMSLMMKGLSPGIAFVMLMAGPAANFASIMILNKTQGRRATAIYVISIVVTAIVFGLAIDMLMPASWFALPSSVSSTSCHISASWFDTACSILLIGLLIYAATRQHNHNHTHITTNEMTQTFTIKGMNCPHCQAAVEKAIRALDGVTDVTVNLSTGLATVIGNIDPAEVAKAVTLAGFSIE